MRQADLGKEGPWRELFAPALALMAHLESVTESPRWSFGGGTVLMLRLNHRQSRDIDLFVPDPQYLGYVNPRLSDVAEDLTHHYTEAAEYLKLFMPTGEIDVVVGETLTADPFEEVSFEGRLIRVEKSAEIIAKKMFHRGDLAKARDLFDLCAVADLEPDAIGVAKPFFERHGARFLEQIQARAGALEEEFAQIAALDYRRPFGECLDLAPRILA